MAGLSFGDDLRRRRLEAGLSLSQLAAKVNYSKSHLSKVENGEKRPTAGLARLCDAVLGADGALRERAVPAEADEAEEPVRHGRPRADGWLLRLSPGGAGEFAALTGEQPMSMRFPVAVGDVEAQGALLDLTIRLGQSSGPGSVLPLAITQVHALRSAVPRTRGRARKQVLRLAARAAEFTGWMAQESGDDSAAGWWTERAMEFAAEGADHELVEYGYVRRALVTLYRGDAVSTVHLAGRVRHRDSLSPRLRWLGALREAQGHALAGNSDKCRSALDHAQGLWERARQDGPTPSASPAPRDQPGLARPLGTSVPVDMMTMMVTGWCLHDLGRPDEAAELLGGILPGVVASSRRSRVRFGVRRAFALADDGDAERACAVVEDVLEDARRVDSATVRSDLRGLVHSLRRRRDVPAVRALWPQLSEVLGGRV